MVIAGSSRGRTCLGGSSNPREQLVHAERFGDVVVGASVECWHIVPFEAGSHPAHMTVDYRLRDAGVAG